MKQFNKFLYVFGIVILAVVFVYGYSFYKRHGLKKQFNAAKTLYESGDTVGAIGILEEVYRKSPDSKAGEESAYFLAKSYMNINELEKSENYWNILRKFNREKYDDECLFNLGIIAEAKGGTDTAMACYEELIKEHPSSDLADDAMLNLALIHKEKGNLAEARNELENIVQNNPQSNLSEIVEKELGNINIELLFSSRPSEGGKEYVVKQGDSLFVIAQQFGTTVELIKKCNKLKSDFIKPGDRLKIITEKFSIIVDKSKNILTLKSGENVIKVYRVGTGTGGSTPAGTFLVTNKIMNPPWHKPGEGVIPYGDPRNVLGTRWMGFNKTGYGIHGTWDPDSIGQQASAGCVRLLNADVEEIFEIVPVGTEVTIVE